MKQWIITPTNMPAVIRNCSKCGNGSRFVCSSLFRVNANGKNIDVWLIYKCEGCDTTWNMEIIARTKPSQIEKSLYQRFLQNDYKTAMLYAYDQQVLSKNKAVVCYEDVSYHISKVDVMDKDEEMLEIISSFYLGLRLDKLLSDELGISRTIMKSLFEDKTIVCVNPSDTLKSKVKNTIQLKVKEIKIQHDTEDNKTKYEEQPQDKMQKTHHREFALHEYKTQ